ncbi:MAG TPA: hypothetical protein VF753_00635 [Terriglobales bacterium]
MPTPYVNAALICEKIMQEKDEAFTLIRLVDSLKYQLQTFGTESPHGLKPVIDVHVFISLRAGEVVGEHTVKIAVSPPHKDRKELASQQVTFTEPVQIQNFVLNLSLGVDVDGLYWFDVLFDDQIITRVPLIVTGAPPETLPMPTFSTRKS